MEQMSTWIDKKLQLSARKSAIRAAFVVLVLGFGVMLIFWVFDEKNPQIYGFCHYKAATFGDGLFIPCIVGGAVYFLKTCQIRIRNKVILDKYIAFIVAIIFMIIGVLIQISWLLNPNITLNWTIPRHFFFTPAGWYHAFFFSICMGVVAFYITSIYLCFLQYREFEKMPLDQAISFVLFWYGCSGYFFMHVLDDYAHMFCVQCLLLLPLFLLIILNILICSSIRRVSINKKFFVEFWLLPDYWLLAIIASCLAFISALFISKSFNFTDFIIAFLGMLLTSQLVFDKDIEINTFFYRLFTVSVISFTLYYAILLILSLEHSLILLLIPLIFMYMIIIVLFINKEKIIQTSFTKLVFYLPAIIIVFSAFLFFQETDSFTVSFPSFVSKDSFFIVFSSFGIDIPPLFMGIIIFLLIENNIKRMFNICTHIENKISNQEHPMVITVKSQTWIIIYLLVLASFLFFSNIMILEYKNRGISFIMYQSEWRDYIYFFAVLIVLFIFVLIGTYSFTFKEKIKNRLRSTHLFYKISFLVMIYTVLFVLLAHVKGFNNLDMLLSNKSGLFLFCTFCTFLLAASNALFISRGIIANSRWLCSHKNETNKFLFEMSFIGLGTFVVSLICLLPNTNYVHGILNYDSLIISALGILVTNIYLPLIYGLYLYVDEWDKSRHNPIHGILLDGCLSFIILVIVGVLWQYHLIAAIETELQLLFVLCLFSAMDVYLYALKNNIKHFKVMSEKHSNDKFYLNQLFKHLHWQNYWSIWMLLPFSLITIFLENWKFITEMAMHINSSSKGIALGNTFKEVYLFGRASPLRNFKDYFTIEEDI